jgi:hypothetical protein
MDFVPLGKRKVKCWNPNCPQIYFHANRSDHRYCSAACALPAQRAAKLKWWHENKGAQAKGRENETKSR